jgi:PadR family transcriptional regulator PadR
LLRDRSSGAFDLPEGTVYPALHRLEDAGLLASTWADVNGRRRRVYGLTDQGAAALAAEQAEWRRFAVGRSGRGGVASVSEPRDLIKEYLSDLRRRLELAPDEAALVVTEAEDPTRSPCAPGLE